MYILFLSHYSPLYSFSVSILTLFPFSLFPFAPSLPLSLSLFVSNPTLLYVYSTKPRLPNPKLQLQLLTRSPLVRCRHSPLL